MKIILKISVIVCAYNEEESIRPCIESLLIQKDVSHSDYEIIIVDDQSTDSTKMICEELVKESKANAPYIRYIEMEHRGLSVARNTGLLRTQAPLVAYIDADATADKCWVSEVLKAWEAFPDSDVVGGRIKIKNAKSALAQLLHDAHYNPYDKKEIVGANMSFRKEKLLSIGAFGDPFVSRGDESFVVFKMGDDRCEKKWPAAIVFHDRPSSIRQWFRERMINGRMLIFIGNILEKNNSKWKTIAVKRILLLLLAIGCLFNQYLFLVLMIGVILILVRKTQNKKLYLILSESHALLGSMIISFLWTIIDEIGMFCLSYGVLTSCTPKKNKVDSAWQGTVSDKYIMNEETRGLPTLKT